MLYNIYNISNIYYVYTHIVFPQYLRPFAGSKYTDAAYKLRQIGRHCIEQRIKSIQNNEDVPHDILTQIISITQKEENIQIEDLVDDFVTFYSAGMTGSSLSIHCLFHIYMYIKGFIVVLYLYWYRKMYRCLYHGIGKYRYRQVVLCRYRYFTDLVLKLYYRKRLIQQFFSSFHFF